MFPLLPRFSFRSNFRRGLRRAWIALLAALAGPLCLNAATPPSFEAAANQGAGVIVSDPTLRPMQGPGSPASIFAKKAIDLRGNGRPDLVLAYGIVPPAPSQKMPLRILRPQPDGSLVDLTRQLLGNGPLPGTVGPREILAGDFNEDGRPDIFIAEQGWDASPYPGGVNVLLLSQPDGTYSDASANLPSQPDFTHSAAVGDLDGDGHLDLYVGNIYGQLQIAPYLLLGRGDGTFTQTTAGLPATITSTQETFTASALVDVDGDGALDLVLGTQSGASLDSIVLFNNGTGNFTARPRLVLPAGPMGRGNTIVQGIGAHDLNQDGRPDLVLPSSPTATFSGQGLQILINQGNGTFADESGARLGAQALRTTGSPYAAPLFVDLNQDGRMDFYFGNGPVENVSRYFLAETDGTFTGVPPSGPGSLPLGLGTGVATLFLDQDAAIDLVQVSHEQNGDVLYQSFFNRTLPAITTQPADLTVAVGDAATFTVAATGAPPLTYRWRKGETLLEGATENSFTIPAAQIADAGLYSVVITNAVGTTTSRDATLAVQPPSAPQITVGPLAQTVVSGHPATFTATASGVPAPTFQWLFNGIVIPGATSSSHTINLTTPGHAGRYSVVARNSIATATSAEAILVVEFAPYFTLIPADVTMAAGGPVNWSALGEGVPAPTFQWRRNGVDLPGFTSANFHLPQLSVADAGTYTVVIRNSVGSLESGPWHFSVTDTYEHWRLRTFTPEELTQPALSGATVRSAIDGLPHLVRYALGYSTNPNATAEILRTSTTATDWVCAYRRPSGITDVTCVVEFSADLLNWTTAGVTHERVSVSPGYEHWQARVPLSDAPHAFFRLRVSR